MGSEYRGTFPELFLPLPLANHLSSPSRPLPLFALPAGVAFVLVVGGVNREFTVGLTLAGCLLAWLTQAGVEVRAAPRAMRTYYSLFGRRWGRWQPLPPIVGVTVNYFSELVPPTQGKYSWGIWNDQPRRDEQVVVLLSVQDRPVGVVVGHFALDAVADALVFVRGLADGFAVPVHTFLPSGPPQAG